MAPSGKDAVQSAAQVWIPKSKQVEKRSKKLSQAKEELKALLQPGSPPAALSDAPRSKKQNNKAKPHVNRSLDEAHQGSKLLLNSEARGAKHASKPQAPGGTVQELQSGLNALLKTFKTQGNSQTTTRRINCSIKPAAVTSALKRVYGRDILLHVRQYELDTGNHLRREGRRGSRLISMAVTKTTENEQDEKASVQRSPEMRAEAPTFVPVDSHVLSSPMRAEAPTFTPDISPFPSPIQGLDGIQMESSNMAAVPFYPSPTTPADLSMPEFEVPLWPFSTTGLEATAWPSEPTGLESNALSASILASHPVAGVLGTHAKSMLDFEDQSTTVSSTSQSPLQHPIDPTITQLRDLQVRNQIEYYFSTENLSRDKYLRTLMDCDGWVPLQDILQFPRMKQLSDGNCHNVAAAVIQSAVVEVNWGPPPSIRLRVPQQRAMFPQLQQATSEVTSGSATNLNGISSISTPQDTLKQTPATETVEVGAGTSRRGRRRVRPSAAQRAAAKAESANRHNP